MRVSNFEYFRHDYVLFQCTTLQYIMNAKLKSAEVLAIAPFIPVIIGNSNCDIAFATIGTTLCLCHVHVVNQNTRALLILVFCYFLACASHAPYNSLE